MSKYQSAVMTTGFLKNCYMSEEIYPYSDAHYPHEDEMGHCCRDPTWNPTFPGGMHTPQGRMAEQWKKAPPTANWKPSLQPIGHRPFQGICAKVSLANAVHTPANGL